MAEGNSVRTFPSQEERVETGAIRFGTDWPGLFIRGDNAVWYHMALTSILEKPEFKDKLDLTERTALTSLISILKEPLE